MKKKIIAGLLLVALIVNVFSFGVFAEDADTSAAADTTTSEVSVDSGEAANDTSAPYTTTAISADFQKAAENSSLELYVNKSIGSLAIKDLSTGYIWYSSVASDTYSRDGLTQMQLDQLNSMFVLTYTVLNDNNSKTFTYPINNLKPTITTESISNGVRLNYVITDINLKISVDAILDGDALSVTIPKDKLIEGEGTQTKMKEYLGNIQTFIDQCREDIDKVEEVGVSGNRKGIKNARAKLDEIQELVDGLDSLVGVASAQSKASVMLQDELMNYLCGGTSGEIGIFKRTANSDKSGDDSKDFEALKKTYESKIKKCASQFSLLTGIKIGGVVSIEVLPNFGAANDTENGYVFYPDGSGALTYNTTNHGQSTETYETSVYSDTSVDMSWENNRDSTGLKRMMLPVYGSKKNNQAFLAIIEDADTDASICFLPSGNTVNLNRINSKFTYRNSIEVYSSSDYSTSNATIFEKTSRDITPSVRYEFLNGKNYTADYSGMADAYRDYLLKEGQMKKSSLLNGEMPLALDFIAGTWKSMLFYRSYVSISSTDELTSVVNELGDAGISNILMHLQSWEKDQYPSTIKVPKGAGGVAGIKSLTETLKNAGGNLYLNIDLVDADTDTHKISESKLALGSDSRIYEYQSFWYKLFSPLYIKNNIGSAVSSVEKLGTPGVALSRMGSMIYSDYNTRYTANRGECADIWRDIYNTFDEKTSTASYGGNKYLLDVADWLMDIPMASSGYTFSDQSVPFYQMVVHGSIPYSAKPFNHFYDTQKEKLQTIEYGCIPLYKLTYNDSSNLRKLFNDFTTPYVDVKDDIINTYNEFNGKLSSLTTQYMIRHEKLTDDVVAVTYSNGTVIYINYSDSEYTTPNGVTIPAVDYVIA